MEYFIFVSAKPTLQEKKKDQSRISNRFNCFPHHNVSIWDRVAHRIWLICFFGFDSRLESHPLHIHPFGFQLILLHLFLFCPHNKREVSNSFQHHIGCSSYRFIGDQFYGIFLRFSSLKLILSAEKLMLHLFELSRWIGSLTSCCSLFIHRVSGTEQMKNRLGVCCGVLAKHTFQYEPHSQTVIGN